MWPEFPHGLTTIESFFRNVGIIRRADLSTEAIMNGNLVAFEDTSRV